MSAGTNDFIRGWWRNSSARKGNFPACGTDKKTRKVIPPLFAGPRSADIKKGSVTRKRQKRWFSLKSKEGRDRGTS